MRIKLSGAMLSMLRYGISCGLEVVWAIAHPFQMDPTRNDPAKMSTCTSCTYSEDFSNYWTASMYFKSPENGSYKLVPQMANLRYPNSPELLVQDGGITVYYMQPFGGASKTTSFKPVGASR
jgi:hypothetical protein